MIRRHVAALRSARARAAGAPDDRDAGFTITEVVVAIVLVTITMTALAAFFVNSGKIANAQGERQTAVQVAADAIDSARALTGVGLVSKRDKTSSDALWNDGLVTSSAARFPGVAPYLANLTEAYDAAVTSGGTSAPLPTGGNPVTLDNVIYTQNWFIGYCYSSQAGTSGACAATPATGRTQFMQVIVAVTWADRACANNLCSYVTVTRVSPTPDPLFDESKTAPKPRIANPGDQLNHLGDAVSLSISMSGGTAPLTWTTPADLPAGLTFKTNSTGAAITGTTTAAAPDGIPVLLKVTDAFGFVSTARFTWTVYAAPTATLVATKLSETAIDSVPVPFTCQYTPCTITLASAGQVPGIGLKTTASTAGDNTAARSLSVTATSGTVYLTGTVQNSAVTSGTSKAYATKITITDAGSVGSDAAANWTAYVAPIVTLASSTFTTAVNAVPSFAVDYACYNGPCTLSLTNPVPGVGLDTAVDDNINNTATSISVSGTGRLYLTGKVQQAAVTGTAVTSAQSYPMTLTIADNDSAVDTESSTWLVRVFPSIGWPGDLSVARGGTASRAFDLRCDGSCSVSVTGAPDGIGLANASSTSNNTTTEANASGSGTAYVTGRVGSSVTPGIYTVRLNVTDVINNVSYTVTSVGTWTVTR